MRLARLHDLEQHGDPDVRRLARAMSSLVIVANTLADHADLLDQRIALIEALLLRPDKEDSC